MRSVLSLFALGLLSGASAACIPSTNINYECQANLQESAVLRWKVNPDNAREVHLVVDLPGEGWIGIGEGVRMATSVATVGTDEGTIKNYDMENQKFSGLKERDSLDQFKDTILTRAGGSSSFRTIYTAPHDMVGDAKADLLVAYNRDKPSLGYHSSRYGFTITGKDGEGFSDRDVNGDTRKWRKERRCHGVLFAWVWIFMVPIGILVKLGAPALGINNTIFGKPAGFVIHAFIMFLVTVTTLAALIWTYVSFGEISKRFDSHKRLGSAVLAITLLNYILGAVKAATGVAPLGWAHGFLGFTVWILAVATCFLGACRFDEIDHASQRYARSLKITIAVFFSIFAVLLIAATGLFAAKSKK